MIALTRAAATSLVLLMLSAAACSNEKEAIPGVTLQVVVHECYTATAVEISINGTPLALTPPAQRDDTVAMCYDGAMSLGRQADVRIRTPAGERRVEVVPAADSRFLAITPDRAPYAAAARDRPLLD